MWWFLLQTWQDVKNSEEQKQHLYLFNLFPLHISPFLTRNDKLLTRRLTVFAEDPVGVLHHTGPMAETLHCGGPLCQWIWPWKHCSFTLTLGLVAYMLNVIPGVENLNFSTDEQQRRPSSLCLRVMWSMGTSGGAFHTETHSQTWRAFFPHQRLHFQCLIHPLTEWIDQSFTPSSSPLLLTHQLTNLSLGQMLKCIKLSVTNIFHSDWRAQSLKHSAHLLSHAFGEVLSLLFTDPPVSVELAYDRASGI